MRRWVAKRLDFSFGDWLHGLAAAAAPGVDADEAARRVERAWSPDGSAVVGLSVRTLFDAWLAANRDANGWAAGDRIVFTAITVGDMPMIARTHGFEVASVDLDPDTTAPDPAAIAALLTPRTRALVFTHLYGARLDVGPALRLAHEHGVAFVEDCAEAYTGPSWRGHPESDVALFSFGPIKTATALGGGLARIADAAVRARVRERLATFPVQSGAAFGRRLLKYGGLALASRPIPFAAIVGAARAVGVQHDKLQQRLTRGFPGVDLLAQIRRRPSAALCSLLERRLREGDAPWTRRIVPGERLAGGLAGLPVPGAAARPHGWWLVPVEAPDPAALVARLDREGFDATRGRAFAVVESDPSVGAPPPVVARRLHERLVYLPFSPEMPRRVLDRLGEIVREEIERQQRAGAA